MRSYLVFTAHAKSMMKERMIQEDWVISTVLDPDRIEMHEDDEKHYLKNSGKWGKIPAGCGQSFHVPQPGHHHVL